MILLSGKISGFVEKHPTIKILALSFLLLIGFSLVGEGLDLHIPKGYIYFAMAFSVFVELLNMKVRKRPPSPLKLRNPRSATPTSSPAAANLHPFVRKKTTAQVNNFTLEELLAAHDAVLQADLALKEGEEEGLVLAELVDKFMKQ